MDKNFEKETKRIFSQNLTKWMNDRNKDAEWLSKLCEVSTASAYYWMSGIKIPRMDKIQAIAKGLGINISDLLEEHKSAIDIPSLSTEQLKLIIFGTIDISDDKLNEVLNYARYVKEK